MTPFDHRLRKATYLTAFLGMLALAVAEMNVVYLGLITAAVLVAWHREKHHPDRRIAAAPLNLAILVALGYAVVDYLFISRGWILSVAHFLLIVQMAKLLLPKSDRDHAQIYLISLMNVAVAAIVTVNVFFAVTFILYSATAIWGLILLHFHRELARSRSVYLPEGTDTVRPVSSPDMRAVVSRRFLSTLVVVIVLTWFFNGIVFLFSPRVPGLIHLNPIGFLGRLTGYSDRVELGEMGKILQNESPVMHVAMRTSDGGRVAGEGDFYWRGSTYQHYDGRRWMRLSPEIDPLHVTRHQTLPFEDRRLSTLRGVRWIQQDIMLEPIGTRTLFARGAVAAIKCNDLRMIRENLQDHTVEADHVPRAFTKYTVISAATRDRSLMPAGMPPVYTRYEKTEFLAEYLRLPPVISVRVRELARQIAPADRYRTALERALRIESYLARNYEYTLELEADPDVEPVEDFLFNRKKGHCEYFASSMVILLRAIDIPSRLVSGFHGGQWSEVGEWYIVRQSDAHAWVEAYFEDGGWMRFDPTPGAARARLAGGGALGALDRWIDYLRTTWINYVVQYDRDEQSAILEQTRQTSRGIRQTVAHALFRVGAAFRWIFHVLTDVQRLATLEGVVTLLGALACSTAIVLSVRWLLLRLLGRIRDKLGAQRARRLGRVHVGFYQELQRVLRKRGFVRAPATTPREFADAVGAQMHNVRPALEELTEVFYRIRFGDATLDDAEEHRLRAVIQSVQSAPISRRR